MKRKWLAISEKQRVFIACRRVKVDSRGRERWDRKATVEAIRAHPLGQTYFPALYANK